MGRWRLRVALTVSRSASVDHGFGERPVSDLLGEPELLAEVQTAVDEANAAVSMAESIRKFAILPHDWTEEGGQLTPSLKLKRHVVLRECRDEVALLYRS